MGSEGSYIEREQQQKGTKKIVEWLFFDLNEAFIYFLNEIW
jgi:hypothetical protein